MRHSLFDADFNRRFKRTRLIMKIWGAFIAATSLAIAGFAIYLLTHPETVGAYFGRIINGFTGD